jgi:hypothetical protein
MPALNRPLLAAVGVLALAGSAAAQRPGLPARQGPVVVTPPITNPTVLRSITPVQTAFVPGTITPPTWGYSPWAGPVVQPGFYTPPTIVQNSPGRFVRLPDGKVWNPTTGTFYSPWFNTFTGASGTFHANPWTGTYTNPVTGGSYDPRTNMMVRPFWPGTPITRNPWGF